MTYRAVVGLRIPRDQKEVDRIVAARDAGQSIPHHERDTVDYQPGDIVPFIPEVSLAWLLEQGKVEQVEEEEE